MTILPLRTAGGEFSTDILGDFQRELLFTLIFINQVFFKIFTNVKKNYPAFNILNTGYNTCPGKETTKVCNAHLAAAAVGQGICVQRRTLRPRITAVTD